MVPQRRPCSSWFYRCDHEVRTQRNDSPQVTQPGQGSTGHPLSSRHRLGRLLSSPGVLQRALLTPQPPESLPGGSASSRSPVPLPRNSENIPESDEAELAGSELEPAPVSSSATLSRDPSVLSVRGGPGGQHKRRWRVFIHSADTGQQRAAQEQARQDRAMPRRWWQVPLSL